MGLNFGGGGLFKTSLEELYKGVFTGRKSEVSSAESSVSNQLNLSSTYDAVSGSSITIDVKPDQKVVVMACCLFDADTDADICGLRLIRSGTILRTTRVTMNGTGEDQRPDRGASIMYLDDPGEGRFSYSLEASSNKNDGDIWDAQLVAYAIGVS